MITHRRRGQRRLSWPIRRWTALITALATAVVAAVPGASTPAAAAVAYVPIAGVGSTWSATAIDAWRANVAQYGMTVNYQALGSTTGRNQFANDSTDWAASDIPYGVKDGTNNDSPPARPFAYMPDTAGGTTFMYNLHIGHVKITNLRLSGATIAAIFTGQIKNWNDSRIQNDNPGLTMPATKVVPVVRSDGSGATAQFTQWMVATQPGLWNAYCAAVGRTPCTQTSAYPVLPGSSMVAQAGDLGVSGYVGQQQNDGTIGYVEYSYALLTGFPVAKVLNAAGYYTEPTAGHVAVSLLKAQINMDQADPTKYLTQDLSQVYTNPDPRTYPLSSYSYMILPTAVDARVDTKKGFSLAAFGQYLLCQGQSGVDALGYSALPINLVQAGFDQLKKIPGAGLGTLNIQSCNNPTFSTDGTNTLAKNDPQPQSCDHIGTTQCTTGTGGSANQSTPGKPGTSGTGAGGNGTAGAGGAGTNGAGGAGAAGGASATGTADANGQAVVCDPDTNSCTTAGGGLTGANANSALAIPVSTAATLSNGLQITLMVLAAVLLLGIGLAPPLISQVLARRRDRRAATQ